MDRSRLLMPAAAVLAAAATAGACASTRFDGPDGDRRLYEARCGICHVPYPREHLAPEDWPGILDEMGPRAGLTRSQRERVLGWLTAR
jgi:cytochrome c5